MRLRRRLGRRVRDRNDGRGAAAIEFALISPVLITIVFGILQYGIYFSDSLSADQAVRETARKAVVQASSASCGSGWAGVKCTAEDMAGNSSEDTYVNVSAPQGWSRGNVLRVCLMVKSAGGFGVLPMPHGGYVRSSLEMSIEEEGSPPSGSGVTEPAPAGQDWSSWCD